MRWWAGLFVFGGLLSAPACGERLPQTPALAGQGVSLILLHTSDLHSQVWPARRRIAAFESELGLGRAGALEEVGGFARLATVLERERQRGAALWLDSGDVLEGAEVFRRFGGRVELELLSRLGLSALALGNHELSLTAAELAALLDSASFPVLAANLSAADASPLAGRLAASTLVRAVGNSLGVIGVSNPISPPNLRSRPNSWELELAPDVADAVQIAIDELSPRAELIIVLSHLGIDADRGLVRATTGIDLLLGGHQHIVTAEPDWQTDCELAALRERRGCGSRAVPIVHSGAYGKFVSRIELLLRPADEAPSSFEVEAVSLSALALSSGVPEQPELLELLERLEGPPRAPLGFLPQPLLRRSALGGDSPLGNLTADAMRAASGADVALLNSSSLRADLEAGVLLGADLDLALPFAERWSMVWLSGAALRQGLFRGARRAAERGCESAVQVSGLELHIDCSACRAASSDCVEVSRLQPWGGVAFEPDQLVLAALPAYLTLPGADFEFAGAGWGESVAVSARDAVAHHVAQLAAGAEREPCERALVGLSEARCAQAFGRAACPLDRTRALSFCGDLPWLLGERDGRVQMLP